MDSGSGTSLYLSLHCFPGIPCSSPICAGPWSVLGPWSFSLYLSSFATSYLASQHLYLSPWASRCLHVHLLTIAFPSLSAICFPMALRNPQAPLILSSSYHLLFLSPSNPQGQERSSVSSPVCAPHDDLFGYTHIHMYLYAHDTQLACIPSLLFLRRPPFQCLAASTHTFPSSAA